MNDLVLESWSGAQRTAPPIDVGRPSAAVRDFAREQGYIFRGNNLGGQRPGFTGDRSARRAHLRPDAGASISRREPESD